MCIHPAGFAPRFRPLLGDQDTSQGPFAADAKSSEQAKGPNLPDSGGHRSENLFLCHVLAYVDRVKVDFAKLKMQQDLRISDSVYGLGAGIFFIGYFFFAGLDVME